MIFKCLPLLLLLFSGATYAAGGYAWSDSVFTQTLDAEKSLQEILDSLDYSINVSTDELGLAVFSPPAGKTLVNATLEYIGSASEAPSGWYYSGDISSVVELFTAGAPAGSEESFSLMPGDEIGLFLGPTLYDDTWYSEPGFNWDDSNHVKVFPSGTPDGYVIAWEDLPEGGDQDFNDMIVELVFVNPNPLTLSFSGDTYYLFCVPYTICFDVEGTGGTGDLTLSLVTDGVPTVVATGPAPLNYEYCYMPYPTDSIHSFAFLLEDQEPGSVADTFLIEIDMQSLPEITIDPSLVETTICEIDTICFDVIDVFDDDGDEITLSLYNGDGVIDPVTGEICFLPDDVDSADYMFIIEASDSCCSSSGGPLTPGGCPRDTVTVRVILAPTPEIITINDTTIILCIPEEICFEARAEDGNGNPIDIYQDCGVGTLQNDELCFTPDTAGTYKFCFYAYDACGGIVADTVNVTVIYNEPPVAFAGNDSTLFQCGSEPVCWPASCSDPDDNLLSCELVSALGTFDGYEICFDPPGTGLYEFVLKATDDCGEEDYDTVEITVQVGSPPSAIVGDTSLALCEPVEICIPASCDDVDDDLVSCELISPLGVFDGAQICYTPASSGTYEFILKATDACDFTAYDTGYIEVTLNTGPQVNPGGGNFTTCEPETICVPALVTDPDNDYIVTSTLGEVRNNNLICIWTGEGGERQFVFDVIATDTCGAADTAEYVINVVVNTPPEIVVPTPDEESVCEAIELCFDVDVIDPIIGKHLFTILEGEGAIDPVTGEVCFTPGAAGDYAWTIEVEDSCGATDTGYVNWLVNFIPDPTPVVVPADGDITICFDEDAGEICVPITFDSEQSILEIVVEFSHPAIPWSSDIDYDNGEGEVCFSPTMNISDTYQFTFLLIDICDDTAMSIYAHTVNYVDCDSSTCLILEIEQTECLTLSSMANVDISVGNLLYPIAGYDLLIQYDVTALSFVNAEIGSAVNGWEYFTYRLGLFANCPACPDGLIKLVALADANNGPYHPPVEQFTPDGPLATISFRITSNTTYSGLVIPVKFFWFDCTDNGISSVSGDTLFVDLRIYNPEHILWDENDDVNFPESDRVFGLGIPDECVEGDKTEPLRCIEFWNGSVCIIHLDSIDARGDINLNAVAYEIADAVLFTNYFLHGPSVFKISIAAQTAATDVNMDGMTLTVGDLIYLVRVITGDALPNPKLSPWADNADINYTKGDNSVSFNSSSGSDIGAIYTRLKINESEQFELVISEQIDHMILDYAIDGDVVNILIHSDKKGHKIPFGSSELFTINGVTNIEILHIEAGDYYGNMLNLKTSDKALPEQFELSQNYPNPFNPETSVNMYLPTASDWELAVFNVNGQLVRRFSGSSSAGVVTINWDATDQNGEPVATGVYFYKATACDHSATKKMLLIK